MFSGVGGTHQVGWAGCFFLPLDTFLDKFKSLHMVLQNEGTTMTRMVTDKALALLTQSVSDIVGDETRIASALSRAIHTGSPMDLVMAQASFDDLDATIRRQIQGYAMRLATGTMH
jgi:hypothetical protein